MKESQFFSSLFLASPDYQPIIHNIRKKYDIEEISPEDDGITEILLADEQIDWDAVHQDIEDQLRANPEILPPGIFDSFQKYNKYNNQSLHFPELDVLDPESREHIVNLFKLLMSLMQPQFSYVENFYTSQTDMIFEFLITGKTRDIPQGLISQVQTIQMFGNPVVLALASQLADPKEVSEEFRKIFKETFGEMPKLSEGNMKSLEYLRMKLEGKPIRDILDVYILRNPRQFPSDKSSIAYKRAREKNREMLKKRIQRLENYLDKRIGDKKTP